MTHYMTLARRFLLHVFIALFLLVTLLPIAPSTASAATFAAASAQSYDVYIVQRGDTLSSIARRFGTTVAVLKQINGISNSNQIVVGQRLLVPASGGTSTITTYVVQRGDTLSAIARRFNTTTAVLLQLNGLVNPNQIRVGQRLIVPGSSGEGSLIRVKFPAGGTAATVTGSVVFPQQVCYVLGTLARQTITVQITSPANKANFLFKAADPALNAGVPFKRLENEDRTLAMVLPANGDYIACVATPSGSVTYSITFTIPPATSGSCTTPSSVIRSTDWNTILLSEPAFTHQTISGQHYITVIASSTGLTGIPNLSQIAYGDFDSDCKEEAAIPLISGGTAGDIGYVVYRSGTPRPTVIAWGDGYKLGLGVEGKLLVVSNAVYAGWEPNCCPSGRSYAKYKLVGNTLTLVSSSSVGFVEMQVPTVEEFYTRLQAPDYAGAYALTSAAFQASNPFAAWQAGYNNTIDFTYSVALGVAGTNRVNVTLVVTESTSGGGSVVRTYAGSWELVWDGSRTMWVLSNPSFALV